MSYKHVVLRDKPTSFYLLDEVRSSEFLDYNIILSNFATYQDVLDNYQTYSELNGLPIYDYSGNNNDGIAMFASKAELLPIIAGGVRGTQILSDTSILLEMPAIANKTYPDTRFTLEIWSKPCDSVNEYLPVLADVINNNGIYYNNGDYVFKVGPYEARYKQSNKRASHIVGIYDKYNIKLFINGYEVSRTNIDGFHFINESSSFQIGPALANKDFIVDCAAMYRYSLQDAQIKNHYVNGVKEINYSQIVTPDNGYLFSLYHSKNRAQFRYYMPISRKWSEVADENVIISSDESYITFKKTDAAQEKTFTFVDTLLIPDHLITTTSQLSYGPDEDNIVIRTSPDNINWEVCKNNEPIPNLSGVLFMEVTMTSSDTSKDLPKLGSITVDIFSDKDFYADNSGYKISASSDYALCRYNNPILLHDSYNGAKMVYGGSLDIDIQESIRTVEMIFTPVSGAGVLVSSNTKIFEWDVSGNINKSGISTIWVNGHDVTASTNINDFFTNGYPHYIAIVFSSAASDSIKLNSNQDGSKSITNSLYSNIAVYPTALSTAQISSHYDLYRDRPISIVDDTSFLISESADGRDGTAYFVNEIGWTAVSL